MSIEDLWHYQYYFKDRVLKSTDAKCFIKEGHTNNKCIIIKEGNSRLIPRNLQNQEESKWKKYTELALNSWASSAGHC